MQTLRSLLGLALAYISFVFISTTHAGPTDNIPQSLNVKGGFVVHLGCGDGTLTLTLRPNSRFQVHGLDADPANVSKARATVRKAGVYGPVSIDRLAGNRLPYIDGMVNLLVAENLGIIGDDVEQRVRFARRWFDWRGGSTFQREGVTSSADHRLYDKYGVLYRDSLTLGELLRWYEENGITQQASFPMAMRDMLSAYEAHSGGDGSGLKRIIAGVASGLLPGPPGSRKWRWVNRRYMEGLLLVMGLYDYGSAFRVLGQKGPAG